MTLVSRLLPAPLLSASIVVLWLLLARASGPGQLLLAALLGFVLPLLSRSLRANDTRVRRPLVVVRFLCLVGYDVLISNLEVLWGVLRSPWKPPRAAFVIIPLDLRAPHGLASLAMVTTVVPGTVWSELALDRSALLLHVWDLDDEQTFIAHFKARYEAPLREIFE